MEEELKEKGDWGKIIASKTGIKITALIALILLGYGVYALALKSENVITVDTEEFDEIISLETGEINIPEQDESQNSFLHISKGTKTNLANLSEVTKSKSKSSDDKNDNKTNDDTSELSTEQTNENILDELDYQECSFESNQQPSHKKVILNEVAWMGSETSSNDEWIELKNISNVSVDISGWQVIDKGEQIHITFESGSAIPAGGFYLLERTDDDSIPAIIADVIYSGSLSNTNEAVRVFDKDCNLIDEVFASPDWPAGDSASKRTMEREANYSWHTYGGDANSGIYGTPRAKNGQALLVQQEQEEPPPQQEEQQPPPTQQTATTTPEEPTAPSGEKVLISEVMVGVEGNSGYEFIELYNPTANTIDLTGWTIKKRSSTGSESSLLVTSRLQGKSMASHGYFLAVNEGGYSGVVQPDASWAKSNTLAYSDNSIVVYNDAGEKIDEIVWTSIPKGESFERASWEGNQFNIQPVPNPQNSQTN